MAELNPQPLPPRMVVYVPSDVNYDLDKMQKVTASVLEKLGCGHCHSGRILDFRHLEEEFTVHPETLEVRAVKGSLQF